MPDKTDKSGGANEEDVPLRKFKHWTKEEEAKLALWYGVQHTETIARKLERTPWGVDRHAMKMGICRSQGSMSLRQLSIDMGYDPEALLTVAKMAGVHLKRLPRLARHKNPKNPIFAFSDEDRESIIEVLNSLDNPNRVSGGQLRRLTWGRGGLPGACVDCGESVRPHRGRRLCNRCYQKHRAIGDLHTYPRIRPPTKGNGT